VVAKNIEDNIKSFLNRKNIKADRRLIVFLFFVVLATIFWFLNQLEEEYVTDISLPVRYTNMPPEKILVNELPDQFKIRVRAHGYKLLEYKISNKFLPFQINVNSITLKMLSGSDFSKLYALTRLMDDKIENQLSSELEIVSISPDTIYFEFADRIFKKVPIASDIDAKPATQYMIYGDINFNPDSITISGAEPIIDTINEVFTNKIELFDLAVNYIDDIKLNKIDNVNFSEDKVDYSINVEKFTEGSKKIKLHIVNVPDSLIVRTFPKEITVTYLVALSDYEKVLPELFEAVVDYKETNNQLNQLNIKIQNSPDYIRSLRYNPKTVEFIIERK
jgi:YbbR domain-containing protein